MFADTPVSTRLILVSSSSILLTDILAVSPHFDGIAKTPFLYNGCVVPILPHPSWSVPAIKKPQNSWGLLINVPMVSDDTQATVPFVDCPLKDVLELVNCTNSSSAAFAVVLLTVIDVKIIVNTNSIEINFFKFLFIL